MTRRDNHAVILRIAEEMFLTRGFDQVTLEDVRIRAKVGKGTIYRYFKNKEDLYARVILSGLDELDATIKEHADGTGTTEGKLLAAATAMQRFYGKRRSLIRLLHTEEVRRKLNSRSLHEELRARRQGPVKRLASIIRAGVKSREYSGKIPALTAARMFMALTREAARTRSGLGSRALPLGHAVELFLDGIRKR
jgi:AcrR family transcriptional regulator